MLDKDLSLAGLVNLEDWQKIQDQFSEALEITLWTVSLEGEFLTRISRPNLLTTKILPNILNVHNSCRDCTVQKEQGCPPVDLIKETSLKCPFGLNVFAVPVMAVGRKTIACVILGPLILKSRKSVSEYAKDAKILGISLEELMDAMIEINVFSYSKVQTIISLLQDIFSHMAQIGYHKKRLGEIIPEVAGLDPIFSKYYEVKILNLLLNSCTLALNADSGSVMTLDKKANTLRIKVASRLDDNIVKNTMIKVGEGIAGFAAATSQSIILPKDGNKNDLAKKMKRRDIGSSMIIPFSKGDDREVYGVINLNIARKEAAFSEKDIGLVKELIRMASIALIPLHKSS